MGEFSMQIEVFERISSGEKLKDISKQMGIKYSSVRKMASIRNFIEESRFLKEEHIQTIYKLGLKAAVLLPLKAEPDYLVEILEAIDSQDITRTKLLELIKSMKEISKSKEELQTRYLQYINGLDDEIAKYGQDMQKVIDGVDKLKEDFKFITDIKKTKPDIFKAYLQLLGIVEGRYCLAKRVNLNLWNKLRRAGIIEVDRIYLESYFSTVSFIKDMDKFVANTINTFKVNEYFKKNESIRGIAPIKYVSIEKQIEPLVSLYIKKIEECEADKVNYKDKIIKSSQKAIKNYFEQRNFRDSFVDRDTITHANIAKGALKWLVNNEYVGTIELKKDRYQFDVAAYKNNEIIIVEAKVSRSDLNADDKLLNYLNYCDKLYIASNSEYVCRDAMYIADSVGVILLNKSFRFQKIMKEAISVNNGEQDLKHSINVKNSKLLAMTL